MAIMPMFVEPGELLTTTENKEDVDYNSLWRVPAEYDGARLEYGDLMTVIACQRVNPRGNHITAKYPTWVLHHRSQRVLHFDDITDVGWISRPSEEAVAWRRS